MKTKVIFNNKGVSEVSKPKTTAEKIMNILRTCGVTEFSVSSNPGAPNRLDIQTEYPLSEKITNLIFENTPEMLEVHYTSTSTDAGPGQEPQQELKMAQAAPEPSFDPEPVKEEPPAPEAPPTTEAKLPPAEEKAKLRLPAIMAGEAKYLQATDLEGRYRLAQAFFKSGMVPKGYKDGAAVFAGMELAIELGLKPFTALKNIAVINGNPSLWGDLPLSLVRRSGYLEKISEILLDKDYNEISWRNKNLTADVFAAVCITRRKGNDADLETVFTMDMARTAGLLSKDNVWKTYPRRMIQMRARSQNLKDGYGDILMGIEIAEYDHNFLPNMKDVTPGDRITREGEVKRDNAATLNDTLKEAH